MSEAFDSKTTALMSNALHQALIRLKTLGLVDGDAAAATAILTQLIIDAAQKGERDEENLVLYALGRYQAARQAEVGSARKQA